MRVYLVLTTLMLTLSAQTLKDKHLQEQLDKEKKYAKEQQFYHGQNYDLKAAEVDMESVKKLPDVEDTNADFDMDNVYD